MVYNGLIHQCGKGLSLSIHKKGNKQFLPTLFVPPSCLTVLSRYVNASFVKSSLPVALDSGGGGGGGGGVSCCLKILIKPQGKEMRQHSNILTTLNLSSVT